MSATLHPLVEFSSPVPLTAIFLPASRFFMRVVPLMPGTPPLVQAELAIEGQTPFPMAHLHWGYVVAPAGDSALVYCAYRRRFTNEEIKGWEGQDVVAPEMLPLLGLALGEPGLRILEGERRLSGFAWDGKMSWPVTVHAREYALPLTEDIRAQFVEELRARAGLPEAAAVFLSGSAAASRAGKRTRFTLRDATTGAETAFECSTAEVDALDVRERDFMRGRRERLRRGTLVWRWTLASGLAAALALGLEAGAWAFRLRERGAREQVAAQTKIVERLEAARGLSDRVADLMQHRLRFFEMMEQVNSARPRTLQFLRTDTSGRDILEIEARTSAADDVATYETALRNLPMLAKVEVRDLRTRDGVTALGLRIAFKPGALSRGEGTP